MSARATPSSLVATLVARRRVARAAHSERAARLRAVVAGVASGARAVGAVDAAWLIGSLAWGDFGARSDVDVVVRGADAASLGALAARFGDALDAEIDLMRIEELPDAFARRVLAEGLRIDEP